MKRLLPGLLFLPLWLAAAPLEREIGSGLIYTRVHALPADLPTKPEGRVPPCVVDLRYVETDADGAAAFAAWLKFRATPRTPVLVIANADTSRALVRVLTHHERGTGIAVVGIPRGAFQPDVPVHATAEEERRAYDALEQGAAIGTLLADNPNKVRNDEASLSKDRLAEASADAAEAATKQPAPPVDAALQRAVHLHRSLVALKRL